MIGNQQPPSQTVWQEPVHTVSSTGRRIIMAKSTNQPETVLKLNACGSPFRTLDRPSLAARGTDRRRAPSQSRVSLGSSSESTTPDLLRELGVAKRVH
jgi:hypothetical protein